MRTSSSHRVAYDDADDDDGGELNHQNKILLSFPEKLTYVWCGAADDVSNEHRADPADGSHYLIIL